MAHVDTADLIPPAPQTQALSSKTFSRPPLDGSLSLPEIFDWHLEHSKEHRLFIFLQENGDIREILWPEAVRAVHVGARIVRQIMNWKAGMQKTPVVAILAASGEGFTLLMPWFLIHIFFVYRHDFLFHNYRGYPARWIHSFSNLAEKLTSCRGALA